MLLLSVRRLESLHKTTRARTGNTLLPLSCSLRLTEARLFILPQTVAASGVDVKVPGACGTKGVCVRALHYVCVYLCTRKASVYIREHVRVGVVCLFTLHLPDWMRTRAGVWLLMSFSLPFFSPPAAVISPFR